MDILKFELDKNGENLYIQLYNHIKKLIINGNLENLTKLPPIRQLSEKLKVNTVTVINAYKLLERDGYILKKAGSGSYVNYGKAKYFTDKMDFSGMDSNIDSFPLAEITDSINYVLSTDGVDAFKYEDPEGYPPLKEALLNYFKSYDIDTREELIQIVSGGQQALDIISKSLLDFGDTVISETPTYSGAINSFLMRDARVIYLNLTEDGIDIDKLESKIQVRKPSFIYVMPYYQKPTGITYSHDNKIKILDLANRYNFYIVEDDLGSELNNSNNNRTLKSLDKWDRVIYIKSFTPLFMPGLRLGCIIPPENIFKKLLNVKKSTDISTPGLIQRGFTHYLNKNSWGEYYKELSLNIEKKIQLTTDVLKRDFKNLVTFNLSNRSPLFWIKLTKGDGLSLKNQCLEKDVVITSGESMGKDYPDYFLINIKSIPFENIEKGLSIIKREIVKLYNFN